MTPTSTGVFEPQYAFEDVALTRLLHARHVILPESKRKQLPNPMRLLSEDEWRNLGVQQSRGWEHYAIHKPGMSPVMVSSVPCNEQLPFRAACASFPAASR